MPRSNAIALCGLACIALVACARTSESPPVVTAPLASGTAAAASASGPSVDVAADAAPFASSSAGPIGGPVAGDDDSDAGAPFRSCQADADCIAVPRVGCCHNGWMAAVNSSQKDAYAQSFTCPQPAPRCPMFIVRDTRVARCAPATHLCTMTKVQP